MKRRNDWETRLSAWAQSRLGAPLVYGETDCLMLSFEAVDAMAGSDLAGHWRGRWTSEADGIRYMIKHGTNIVAELHDAGLYDVDAGFQQPGDIIVGEAMADGSAVEKRLRKQLGIGFMRAHVCLGHMSISAMPGAKAALVRTHALLAADANMLHVLRLGI